MIPLALRALKAAKAQSTLIRLKRTANSRAWDGVSMMSDATCRAEILV